MEPKILKFKYTKDSGEVSERKMIVLSKATHLTSGIDISKFSGSDSELNAAYHELKDIEHRKNALIDNIVKLLPDSSFKSFKEKNISNSIDITKEYERRK